MHSNGRVLGYTMNLAPGTTEAVAKETVLREFPTDASILWYTVNPAGSAQAANGACGQMEVKSAELGLALSDPAIGDAEGMAFIELSTVSSDGSSGYDAKNINQALFLLGSYATAADAPAC